MLTRDSSLMRESSFVKLEREICANLAAAESREWLVTNGLGSFASGTVAGLLTRRYHGLLIAALDPPRKRTLLVTKVDEIASLGGREYALGANRWSGGAVDPQGYILLESFWLEGTVPVWRYLFGGAILEKRVWMQRGANTTRAQYRFVQTTGPVKTTAPAKPAETPSAVNLAVKVMVNYRDLHGATNCGDWRMNVEPLESDSVNGLRVTAFDGATPFYLFSSEASVQAAHDWYYNYDLAIERERGLSDREDHLHAATFRASLVAGQTVTLVFTTDAPVPTLRDSGQAGVSALPKLDTTTSLAAEQIRSAELLFRMQSTRASRISFSEGPSRAAKSDPVKNALASLAATLRPHHAAKARTATQTKSGESASAPAWIQQLVFAADQFLVEAPAANAVGTKSTFGESSIIAGYPWFGVWSRDTAISVCGLALVTGRTEFARKLLKSCAGLIDGGMLPNTFPESGEAPEFNTVDAALWFVETVRQYLDATDDLEFAREVFPALAEIVRSYSRGTRFNIHADSADGLLFAGESGTNLTWMDARADGRSITPRIGKPVEVNALWINALETVANMARQIGQPSVEFQLQAKRARDNFERFWNPGCQCCFDVLDGPEGNDASARPNQIFAVSLRVSGLTPAQQQAVVETCAEKLLTPYGLRSLAPNEANYTRIFIGPEERRAAAYHQGTVWAWLLGPFALAHFRVFRDSAAALKLFDAIPEHMKAAGLGTVSEVFDAEAPFAARGCPAQAWSVAEILRAWVGIRASS
jgi:glycogen debranching enzyme